MHVSNNFSCSLLQQFDSSHLGFDTNEFASELLQPDPSICPEII